MHSNRRAVGIERGDALHIGVNGPCGLVCASFATHDIQRFGEGVECRADVAGDRDGMGTVAGLIGGDLGEGCEECREVGATAAGRGLGRWG